MSTRNFNHLRLTQKIPRLTEKNKMIKQLPFPQKQEEQVLTNLITTTRLCAEVYANKLYILFFPYLSML